MGIMVGLLLCRGTEILGTMTNTFCMVAPNFLGAQCGTLNGTHRSPVYTDDDHVLGGSIHTITKNTKL
jgi:hypothetical protein